MMHISPRNKYSVAEGEMANVFTLLVQEESNPHIQGQQKEKSEKAVTRLF